ncbi:vesicle-associated membrane protein [Cladochytrium replicatum]|nr:vesicle-associated membrane protein [Cladochytrium replicatum]
MAIIYALVSRGTTVLAECATTTGNFATITEHILEKIPEGDTKMTYIYDRHLFHYIQKDGIVYMCMADDEFGRRLPFAFLEDISKRFATQYGSSTSSGTGVVYGVNEFSRVIATQMDFYNSDPGADKIRQVQGEIAQVKGVMVQNIERVLERGERIEILVDKTDTLNQASLAFKKRSHVLHQEMSWKSTQAIGAIVGVVIVILYALVCFACGFPFWQKCHA